MAAWQMWLPAVFLLQVSPDPCEHVLSHGRTTGTGGCTQGTQSQRHQGRQCHGVWLEHWPGAQTAPH